jgi:hypothetical protein
LAAEPVADVIGVTVPDVRRVQDIGNGQRLTRRTD